jgi:N-acetylglucosaminyl-diphospho-decaprenol L-rhamnosyltransferase
VDNGSSDGSIEMVRREFPVVDLHVDWSNRGYGAAANQAIGRCTAPFILLLNSDTVLQRGALEAIGDYLERHPRAGILGPRLRSRDGTLQRSCFPFPTPLLPFIGQRPLVRFLTRIPVVRDRHVTAWAHDTPRRVPWVVGAALGIRREAFSEVGGFDESFHMYSEETDLCYRLGAAGWETHFAPVTDITHAGSASTSQYRAAMLQELFLSSIRFYERHFTGRRLSTATHVTRLTIVLRLWRDTVSRRLTRSAARRATYTENVTVWRRLLDDLG